MLPLEVLNARIYLLNTCGRVVGAMASISMGYVVDIFTAQLSERVNPKVCMDKGCEGVWSSLGPGRECV
jgi:hypothetical protein